MDNLGAAKTPAKCFQTFHRRDSRSRSVGGKLSFAGEMGRAQKEEILQAEAEMAIVLSALGHFSLSIAELSESTRRRAVVLPRQIAMYLAKQMTAASLQEMGHSSEENTTRRLAFDWEN